VKAGASYDKARVVALGGNLIPFPSRGIRRNWCGTAFTRRERHPSGAMATSTSENPNACDKSTRRHSRRRKSDSGLACRGDWFLLRAA